MVRPFFASSRKSSIISRSRSGESPLVGSSKKMTLGSDNSSIAMDTRFFCPPERELIFSFSLPASLTSSIALYTHSITSARSMSVRMRSRAV